MPEGDHLNNANDPHHGLRSSAAANIAKRCDTLNRSSSLSSLSSSALAQARDERAHAESTCEPHPPSPDGNEDQHREAWLRCIGSELPSFDLLAQLQSCASCIAASNGDLAMLQAMLAHGADIHGQDYMGSTSLHFAIRTRHRDVAMFLVNAGANLEALDACQRTPLDVCVELGQMDIAIRIEEILARRRVRLLVSEYHRSDYIFPEATYLVKRQAQRQRYLELIQVHFEGRRVPVVVPSWTPSSANSLPAPDYLTTNIEGARQGPDEMVPRMTTGLVTAVGTMQEPKRGQDVDAMGGDALAAASSAKDVQAPGPFGDAKRGAESESSYNVVFNVRRGACQVLHCKCPCFFQSSHASDAAMCSCSHYAASHGHLGVVSPVSSDAVAVHQKRAAIDQGRETQDVLVPINPPMEYPRKLNPRYRHDGVSLDATSSDSAATPTYSSEAIAEAIPESLIQPGYLVDASNVRFDRVIGQGANATLYLGMLVRSGGRPSRPTVVAIKLLRSLVTLVPGGKKGATSNREAATDKIRRELLSEFKVNCRLQCKNTVAAIGIVLQPTICILMEYMSKGSLYGLLMDPGLRMTWSLVLTWFSDLAKGLAAMHESRPQILYRDLKSPNVLVSPDMRLKASDFGLSRFVEASNMSTLGKLRGTYAYAAPEVFLGQQHRPHSDIYAVGIVYWEILHRLLTGAYQRPFEEFAFIQYHFQIIIQVARAATRPTILPTCPEPVAILVRRLWSAHPPDRPTAKQLIAEVQGLRREYKRNRRSWDALVPKVAIAAKEVTAAHAEEHMAKSTL